jgi:hypothetical protein
VHELVLALSDFYVSQETPDLELPAGVTLPGLQHISRFGTRSHVPGGWRPWLSQWFIGADAGAAGSVVAAMVPVASIQVPAFAWIATPMHLIAGMTSVHVDRRSILRLDRVFHDSGFHLQPLEAGDFLMLGPQMSRAETKEPARAVGASMSEHAGSNPALRKLGVELEMWLHDHPINDSRRRRGELPVTGLWLWGGGLAATTRHPEIDGGDSLPWPTADARARTAGARASTVASTDASAPISYVAFGRDSYMQGLWALRGAKVEPLPQHLADVFSYSRAQRAVVVIEIGLMLQSNPGWTFFEAVAEIDRRFIAPAVDALNRGQFGRLVVLANDYELTLRAADRLKFWRRAPSGLSGLQ